MLTACSSQSEPNAVKSDVQRMPLTRHWCPLRSLISRCRTSSREYLALGARSPSPALRTVVDAAIVACSLCKFRRCTTPGAETGIGPLEIVCHLGPRPGLDH